MYEHHAGIGRNHRLVVGNMLTLDGYKPIENGVCAPKGFLAAGINAGVKKGSKKRDLAVIYSTVRCTAAALYTQNKVKGAPILVTQEHLKDGYAQAVIANSGNANTCNSDGLEVAHRMCNATAKELGISPNDIIVASTGVIGQPLNIEAIEAAIPSLCKSIHPKGSDEAADAIMTTDTRKKEHAVEFSLTDGTVCRVGGISKGSGMIHPNMATLLAFITTDVNISLEMLKQALHDINEVTYNMVSVDRDTSTNDTLAIMASGLAGNKEITVQNEDYDRFYKALYAVLANLAMETARDGEGATKLIQCVVTNAVSESIAKAVAKSVICSPLVKSAMFAADANWGRILCAIGYTEGDFSVSNVSVDLASKAGIIRVCEKGTGVLFSEEKAHQILLEDEISILIDFHENTEYGAVAWGCDLTYDYVKINAEYRT